MVQVQEIPDGSGASGQRPVGVAVRALLCEMADADAYRAVAAKVKYPTAAMLVSQTVLTFAATAVLARSLGPSAFGEYALILTIAGIFQLVAAFPVESGIPKFLAEARQRAPDDVRPYYAAGLWCRLGAGGLGLLICVLGARWLSRAYGAEHLTVPLLIASLSLCLLTPIALYFMSCIQGMERPRRWAAGNLLTAVLVFPLLLAGAIGFAAWGLPGLMAFIAAGWLLCAFACAWLARGSLGFLWPSGAQRRHFRQLIPFLLPIWIVPLAGFGSKTLMKSALAWTWGPIPLGHFEVALTLLGHMAVVYQACMIVLLPEWARLYASRRARDLAHSLAQARGVLLGVALAYGALLALAGHWVVPAIFGRDQSGAVPAARIIGIVMPIMIGGWLASATNVISNRTGNIGMANVIWFSVGVPLGLALIPVLGALGASLAWLGAYCIFTWYYVTRARPFHREIAAWQREAVSAPPRG